MADWLRRIPFLDLDGPRFLDFYLLVAIGVLAVAWLALRFADRTDRRPPPAVPQQPDAIETAYLAGGVNDVVRTIVYDLAHRGYVTLGADERLSPGPKTPAAGELNAMQRRVLATLQFRPKAGEIFQNLALRKELEAMLAPLRARLASKELLRPEAFKSVKRRVELVGSLVLATLAGAKLYLAAVTGKPNVAFLVFLAIASILLLFSLTYVASRGVASRRGRALLDDMKLAYADRFKLARARLGPKGSPFAAGMTAFEGASLFMIGLYGFSALHGTADDLFAVLFRRASGDAARGCGSSCSAGGEGDGGSGCGGCGGD